MEEADVTREVCDTLEEFGGGELLGALANIIDDWLFNKEMDPTMLYARLLIGFGKGGAILITLLRERTPGVISLLDECLEKTENKLAIYRVRGFIAKYHPLVYMEERRRLAPYLVRQLNATPMKRDPVVIRVEAQLNNGQSVILEMDMSDIGKILSAVKEANERELLETFTHLSDNPCDAESDCSEEEDDADERGVLSERRVITNI